MKKKIIAVLGGGISGLAFASKSKHKTIILEKENTCGGHCNTKIEKNFTYDVGGPHILFSKNKKILKFMVNLIKDNIVLKKRNNQIFYKGKLIKYPFENGINELNPSDKFNCVNDFIFNKNKKNKSKNFRDWLYYNFGNFLTDEYMLPYNEKIWNTTAEKMNFDWVEGRVPISTNQELIKTAVGIPTEGYKQQLYFYYPKKGGYEEFCKALERKCKNIQTKFEIKKIYRVKNKWIIESNKELVECDQIVSTIPIRDLLHYFNKVPNIVKSASNNLKSNSLIQISLAFKIKRKIPYTAIYFPNRDYLFHRISFPHNFSKNNVPKNNILINFEITVNKGDGVYEKNDEYFINHCLKKIRHSGLIKKNEEISYKNVERTEYAYVVRDFNYKKNLNKCLNFIENKGIYSLGRNAQFTYINSDEAVRRGLNLANEMNDKK
jgi:protoporphyrinogen oxidase